MGEFENNVAGALADAHVQETLITQMEKNEDFAALVGQAVRAHKRKQPKIHTLAFWKRSAVFGPLIAAVVFFGGITGVMKWLDTTPHLVVHKALGTDSRVVALMTSTSDNPDNASLQTALESRVVQLIEIDGDEPSPLYSVIRKVVTDRPLFVSHDLRPIGVEPTEDMYSQDCRTELATYRDKEHILTRENLSPAQAQLSKIKQELEAALAADDKRKAYDLFERTHRLQTNVGTVQATLDDLADKRKAKRQECIAEVSNPSMSITFHTDLSRDNVDVRLRLFRITKDRDFVPVPTEASDHFKVSLGSIKGEKPYSIPMALVSESGGLFKVKINPEDVSGQLDETDMIYTLKLEAVRSKVPANTADYLVGAVFEVNK